MLLQVSIEHIANIAGRLNFEPCRLNVLILEFVVRAFEIISMALVEGSEIPSSFSLEDVSSHWYRVVTHP